MLKKQGAVACDRLASEAPPKIINIRRHGPFRAETYSSILSPLRMLKPPCSKGFRFLSNLDEPVAKHVPKVIKGMSCNPPLTSHGKVAGFADHPTPTTIVMDDRELVIELAKLRALYLFTRSLDLSRCILVRSWLIKY